MSVVSAPSASTPWLAYAIGVCSLLERAIGICSFEHLFSTCRPPYLSHTLSHICVLPAARAAFPCGHVVRVSRPQNAVAMLNILYDHPSVRKALIGAPTVPCCYLLRALCLKRTSVARKHTQGRDARSLHRFWRSDRPGSAQCDGAGSVRVRACADGGGLAPLLRIRSHGETENMRRLCAVFVAEMSMAEGMQELIGELDAITR